MQASLRRATVLHNTSRDSRKATPALILNFVFSWASRYPFSAGANPQRPRAESLDSFLHAHATSAARTWRQYRDAVVGEINWFGSSSVRSFFRLPDAIEQETRREISPQTSEFYFNVDPHLTAPGFTTGIAVGKSGVPSTIRLHRIIIYYVLRCSRKFHTNHCVLS